MPTVKNLMKATVILFAIIVEIGIISVSLVFYGPFTGLKELVVTSAMTTFSHQYLVQVFLSDQEIQSIMEKNRIKDPVQNSDTRHITVLYQSDTESFTPTLPVENTDPMDDEPKIIRMIQRERIERSKSKIEHLEIKNKNFSGHMLIVHDPSRVRVVTTDKLGEIGIKLKDLVDKHDVIGGINGGGFVDHNGEGFGGVPTECIIENSRIIFGHQDKKYDIIGFNMQNVLVLGKYTLAEAIELGIRDAIGFSPFLVVNGEPVIKEGNGGWDINPRTAIGQTKDGKVLMLVIDGRQVHSIGATLKDAQEVMLEFGAYNAANLDGGSSTVMYYEGKLVNKPCSPYGERFLPSAFVINKINN